MSKCTSSPLRHALLDLYEGIVATFLVHRLQGPPLDLTSRSLSLQSKRLSSFGNDLFFGGDSLLGCETGAEDALGTPGRLAQL